MELVYKMFGPGLMCRGYQYKPGEWSEEKEANCVRNGLHAAKNPLDCLSYYQWDGVNECWVCIADGDVDEDGVDSKVSVTRLKPVRRLSTLDFVNAAVHYALKHREARNGTRMVHGPAETRGVPFVFSVDENPAARGWRPGDVLALVETGRDGEAVQVGVHVVGENGIKPGKWYGVDGKERIC